MEWCIKQGASLNLRHFLARARDSHDWLKETITSHELMELLHAQINAVNLDRVRADISRFIPYPKMLEIWSRDYFHDLVGHLKIVE